MQAFLPKETYPAETRVPIIPDTVKRLATLEASVVVESGLGEPIGIEDEEYEEAGAALSSDREKSLGEADMVLRLRRPPKEEVGKMKNGSIHISHLDPFRERDLINDLAGAGISAISMEMIPRTTIAQKMDALSSQANLGGYVAVILAAQRLRNIMPMMMTPSGTITPARVFVIGAGVAGLQAIATAKRLGARVEAFDTRPVVEEQVKSLGANFLKVDLGETGETQNGYARELTEEQLEKQRQSMAKACEQADAVITTAQVFGKKAPLIITQDIVKRMKKGSVIVDMAVESGGNVEGSKLNEDVSFNGVTIIGRGNLPGLVPVNASQMYSSNLCSMIEHFWDKDSKRFNLNLEDEIIKGCLVTHGGAVVNKLINH